MSRVAALALVLVVVPSACLFSPENNAQVCGANASVTFSGFVPQAGALVAFQAAPSATGPWTTFSSVNASTQALAYAGGTYYAFNRTTSIPTWSSEGAWVRTYVRARLTHSSGNTSDLFTFDRPPPGGQSGLSCINARVSTGDNLLTAIGACDSATSPVATLRAPALSTCPCTATVVTGNLVIDSARAAAEHVCTTAVTGDLTITEATPESLHFPALTTVGGDVDFSYAFPSVTPLGIRYVRRSIDASALTTVGGDVRLYARRDEGEKAAPQGLNAVTSVGGDITLTLHDTNPQVLNGLTSVAGSVTIQGPPPSGNLDINAGGSFQALTSVGGDLRVRHFFSANGFFPAVQSVGGHVLVGDVRLHPSPSFNALATVTGDVRFESTKQLGPPWPTTTSIGGDLVVSAVSGMGSLADVPTTLGAVGGLRLLGNTNLSTLSGKSLQLGARDVVISGNPVLPQCRVNTFLAAQTAGGWTGAASVSGTAAGPCP